MNSSLPDRAKLRERNAGRARFSWVCAPLVLLVFCPVAAYPQTQKTIQAPPTDLARQNFERVAASATEIEAVLHRDAGLVVELKRWVAKDATDRGQLISDSDLTDQGIYDRLEADVQFRAVATVLLQKYGYLLPRLNPESPQGKEQELVIQDRAKWLAQDEEEQLSQARRQTDNNLQQARTCDPRQDLDCNAQRHAYPAGERPQEIGTPVLPQRSVPPGNSNEPPPLQRNSPSLEEAQLMQSGTAEGAPAIADLAFGSSYDSMSPLLAQFGQARPGTLLSSPFSADGSESGLSPTRSNMFPTDRGAGNSQGASGLVPGLESSEASMGSGEMLRGPGGNRPEAETNSRSFESESSNLLAQPERYRTANKANLSQALVRQPAPYVDVPSLYDMYLQAAPQPPSPERFGMEVFENGTRDTQLIPFDLPVGPDYVVGPGDGLAIDLWGGVSQRLLRTVDREGRVSLPEAGPLLVAGKSLADVQESVQKTLRSQFRDVSADVSLSRLRTIRVYVVGDIAHPGAYDISSLSTPLNALFAAGGPTSQGSLRVLDHNRGNQLVQNVDVYDLLLHGVKTDIQRLENGDTVLVPSIGPEVSVEGMVRRPAIYELRDEKSLSDVLTLAGGLLPTATLRHIEVQRVVAHDKRTMMSVDVAPDSNPDSTAKQLDSFQVQDGDNIRVFPIAPYNQDTLYLEGHVLRPGRYSFHSGMRVTDLIASYKDLLPEPATQYAEIIRLNPPDFRPTVESFDLADALSHPGSAPLLEPLDTVQIFGRYDFENPPTVSVWGDVRSPGTYRTSGQLHLSDAIHMAGGLSPEAEKEDAQVFRYLPDGQLKIFSVKLGVALAGDPSENIVLNSRDRILVHRNAFGVEPATVYIKGEVASPGRYPLTANMTVADLIQAAGGPKQSADRDKADLTHYEWTSESRMTGQHEEIELADTTAGSKDTNVSLHNGDVLTIRKLPGWDDLGASITVRGEVKHPGTYGIRPGERLSSVLERAGGFAPAAYPYGAVLERTEVRELEAKAQTQIILRVKDLQSNLELLPDTDPKQKQAKEMALQQYQATLTELTSNPPVGRVAIRISTGINRWENTTADVDVRAGDTLVIPKKPGFVMVTGQVFNPTAVSYRPGKSANWYLGQSGGPTPMANRKAIFVIRADGSVIGAKESILSGNSLRAELRPGDTVVVPEKPIGGGVQWQAVFLAAQVASSITSAVFIAVHY